MLVFVLCVMIPLAVVSTGRVDYALSRREGIKRHGLDLYQSRHESLDQMIAVFAGLGFPLWWTLAAGWGVCWLLKALITVRPLRSEVEQQELVKQMERELGYREN